MSWKKSEKMLLPLITIQELRLWYLFDLEFKELEDKLLFGVKTGYEPSFSGFLKFWREMSKKYWVSSKNGKFYYKYGTSIPQQDTAPDIV